MVETRRSQAYDQITPVKRSKSLVKSTSNDMDQYNDIDIHEAEYKRPRSSPFQDSVAPVRFGSPERESSSTIEYNRNNAADANDWKQACEGYIRYYVQGYIRDWSNFILYKNRGIDNLILSFPSYRASSSFPFHDAIDGEQHDEI
ncbi:hypothetical protein BGZ81_002639 [Podila clonocystis]|nr:hypothetical protein BGZ81_002639 [Podila clonocystis]